ncbi:unnamed protein product [Peniophora sp. CBMAI 1063]|nr:unnamed protein product [Peniophora sp. CBMAI 1063]
MPSKNILYPSVPSSTLPLLYLSGLLRGIERNMDAVPTYPATSVKRTRNMLQSTAYSLPAEILSLIFRDAIRAMNLPLFMPGCGQHSAGWFILLWVCSRWRDIIVANASIWASCYSHYPKLQAIFLARAGRVPLVYRVNAWEPAISPFSAMFYTDDLTLNKFFAATPLEKCSEIHVADGRGNDVTDHIFALAALAGKSPLRHLRTLYLSTWQWNWSGPKAKALTEGSDIAPIISDVLEDVYFENCWTVVCSPSIERFTSIFASGNYLRPTIHTFYHAMKLSCWNALTTLKLVNPVGGSYRDDVTQQQSAPIAMPSLKDMVLIGYAPHIANLLRIILWPQHGTKLRVRTIVGDGPAQSLRDEEMILDLCCRPSSTTSFQSLSVEHLGHRQIADRTIVRAWSDDWSSRTRSPPDPDIVVSFGGAYLPCAWHETTIAATRACGSSHIRLLVLALLPGDHQKSHTPWEQVFLAMPNLRVLFPWKRVMASIGDVRDDHPLGTEFRKRVVDFETLPHANHDAYRFSQEIC